MSHTNYTAKNKGFGSKTEQRVRIPSNREWQFFKESLEGAKKLVEPDLSPEQAKITAAIMWYHSWVNLRPKPPNKGEKRIAQQLCADYLGSNRAQFSLFVKRLINKANQFSLGGLGNG